MCSQTPGFMMVFDESVDKYDGNHVSLNVIDPGALPRHRVNGQCVPLFPHEALRTNTVFEVARTAGKHTAWADIALIWLGNQSQAEDVRHYLNVNARALSIEQVMAGDEIKLQFDSPLRDSRTPDLIVQPVFGTIYTRSSKKNAEHGGFSFADTNVGLIVSNPELGATTIKTPVATSQVAPTILHALRLDPSALRSVRVEKTRELPELEELNDNDGG